MPVIAIVAIAYSVLFAICLFVFIRFGTNYHRRYGRYDELTKGLDGEIDREAEKIIREDEEERKKDRHGKRTNQN